MKKTTFLKKTLFTTILALVGTSAFATGPIGNQGQYHSPPVPGSNNTFDGKVWSKGVGAGFGGNHGTGDVVERMSEAGSITESDSGLNLGLDNCGTCEENKTSAYVKMRNQSLGSSYIRTMGDKASAFSGTDSNLKGGAALKKN